MRFEVFRDAQGVPHVRAADERALAYGQGWVTARDRAWQVQTDLWRAQGRMAEHIGPAGVAWDVLARRARFASTAQRAHAALGDDDRAWVDAYVDGVNAGLAGTGPGGRRAVAEVDELDRVLGGTTGWDPWPAWAPLAVFLVNHALFSSAPRVLWHDHLVRAARTSGHPGLAGADPLDLVRLFEPAADDPGSGSNAWALHGSRTASGSPLLAGDPHRVLELPGVYQQVRLACDAYDVLGLAFPGVPGVPHFAHTGTAAWGITNAVAHSGEVVRELLRRTGGRRDSRWEARGPGGWEPCDATTEQVLVRGGAPVDVEVLETARGVVVVRGLDPHDPAWAGAHAPGPSAATTAQGDGSPDRSPADPAPADDRPEGEQETVPLVAVHLEAGYALRLQARVDDDLGFGCLRPLLRARTAHDVAAALTGWVDPVNRVLAADADGTVLAFDAGRAADRPPEQRLLPLDAWDPAHAPRPWRPLAPPTAVTDQAADANERPADPARDHGSVYAPHRGDRVRALLAERRDRPLGPPDMAEIHADTHLAGAEPLLALVADAGAPGSAALSAAAADVRTRLLAWDRHMDAGSVGAGLFAALRSALVVRLCAEPGLAPLAAPHGLGEAWDAWFGLRGRVAAVLPGLLARPDLVGDGPAHVRAALEQVAGAHEGTWGDRHTVRPTHVLAEVPGAAVPVVSPVPLGGDQDTVRCTGTVPGVTDRAFRGSVARWVWDLADRDASRWGVPFGTAGDPASEHFADQHPGWAAAQTVQVVTAWDALTREHASDHPDDAGDRP